MTTPVLYPGIFGDVTVSSTTMRTQKWTFSEEGTVNETTTKSDGGFYKSVVTKKKGSGTFDAQYDCTIEDGNPPKIEIGTQAAANFNFDANGTEKITCPVITITKVDYSSDRDGMVTYTCNYETYGVYYLPGQPTS